MNARRHEDQDDAGLDQRERDPCKYEAEHPRLDERLKQSETRLDKQDETVKELRKFLSAVELAFVRFETKVMTGIIVGFTLAGAVGTGLGLFISFLKR
jgi:hypothetical protein